MRIIYTLLFFSISAGLYAQLDCNDTFVTTGTAQDLGQCIQLTGTSTSQQGCAWVANPVDFSMPFTHSMTANFGNIDANGADGICLIYQANSTATCGISGGGIGANGIPNSFIVEFDTWNNGAPVNDIAADHCAISVNGDIDNPINGPFALPNIEDGQDHTITFSWDPISMTYTIVFDGNLVTSGMYDIVNNCFGGNTMPFWGYSASTGASFNNQTICPVLPPPINVDAGIDVTIPCAGASIILDGTGSDIEPSYVFEWSTFNGNIVSGANTLTPTVNAPGTYVLTLTDTDGNCSEMDEVTVSINPIQVSINPPATLPCDGSSIFITGNSSENGPFISYQWSTFDGLILSGENSQTAEILFPGTYTFTVIYDDGFGGICTEEVSVEVFEEFPPSAQATNATITCDPGFVILSGFGSSTGAGITYLWTTNDGVILDGENTLFPTVGAPGLYTLVVVDNITSCTDEITVEVFGDVTPPFAVANVPGTLNCGTSTLVIDGSESSQGNNFTYEWTTLDGQIISGANTDSPTVSAEGTYTLVVTNTENGCSEFTDVTVTTTIDLPIVNIDAPEILNCDNETIQLDASGSDMGNEFEYQWNTPDGQIISGDDSLLPTIDLSGTYTLIITNTTNGCQDSATVVVMEDFAVPLVDAGGAQVIECEDDFLTLEGMASNVSMPDFSWTTNNGNIITNPNTDQIDVDASGFYYLEVLNQENGCSAIDSVFIGQDSDVPVISLIADDSLNCTIQQLLIDATSSSSGNDFDFSWSTPDGNFASATDNLTVSIDAPGTYNLSITNLNNNCSNEASITIFEDVLAPVIDIIEPDTLDCLTLQTNIDATGSDQNGAPFAYEWTTMNGNIVSGADSLMPLVNEPGLYQLEITNLQNNCVSTLSVDVEENVETPVIAFNPHDDLNCVQSNVQLNAAGSSIGAEFTYLWSTSNGNIISVEEDTLANVDQPGIYTLQITDTSNGCSRVGSLNVLIDTIAPVTNAGADLVLNCYQPNIDLDGTASDEGANFNIEWTFENGDLVASGILEPNIDMEGEYYLQIENTDNGCIANDTVQVMADFAEPIVSIAMPQNLTCADSLIALDGTASSSGADFSYSWSTPDGNVFSGVSSNLAQASQAGTYFLQVQDITNGCIATDSTAVIQDEDIPSANIAPANILNCDVQMITLQGSASSGGNNFDYEWQTSNGNFTGGTNTLSPSVDAPGTYIIQVTDLNNDCQAIASIEVLQDTLPPNVDAGADQQLNCFNPSLSLNGNASDQGADYVYKWTSDDGNILTGSNTTQPEIDEIGTYVLELTNTQNGCTSIDSVLVTADFEEPDLQIAMPDSLYCDVTAVLLGANTSLDANQTTYNWSTLNGSIQAGADMPEPEVNAPGIYQVVLQNTTNGCETIDSIEVFQDIQPPLIDLASPDTLNCGINLVQVQNLAADTTQQYSIQWQSTDGNIAGDVSNASIQVDQPGVYEITVVNNVNGCLSEAMIEVEQDIELPTAAVLSPNELNCNVTQINLNANQSSTGSNITYQWATIGGNIINNTTNQNVMVDAPGAYTLTVTNQENLCEASTTVDVSQDITPPVVNIENPAILNCDLTSQQLDATNSSNEFQFQFSWSTTDGNIVAGANSPTPTIDAPGQYFLVINNLLNGCNAGSLVNVQQDTVSPVVAIASPEELNCATLETLLDASASSTGMPFSYSWTGDGIISDPANLNVSVNQAGDYTLAITNTTNFCVSTQTVSVSQDTILPTISIAPPAELNCTIQNIVLDGAASSSGAEFAINWQSLDGNMLSQNDILTPEVSDPGTYILNILNTANQCISEDTVIVTQDVEVPEVIIQDPAILTCELTEQSLDASASSTGPAFSYSWTGDSPILEGEDSPMALIDQAGMYTLTILNTENGCDSTQLVEVMQDTISPIISIAMPEILNCETTEIALNTGGSSTGNIFSYSWMSDDGNIVTDPTDEMPTVDEPGTYSLTITNTENACTSEMMVQVEQDTVQPIVMIVPAEELNCAVENVVLDASASDQGSLFSASWNSPDGNPINDTDPLMAMVSEPGDYELTIVNTNNRCETTVSTNVSQDIEVPIVSVASPIVLNCAVLSQMLDATASSSGMEFVYSWTTNEGQITAGADSPTPMVTEGGDYELTILNTQNFCENSSIVSVQQDTIVPAAIIEQAGQLDCANTQFSLDATNSSAGQDIAYEWTTAGGNILNGENSNMPMIDAPGTYEILVTNTQNFCEATASIMIEQDIEVPVIQISDPAILNCEVESTILDGSGSSEGTPFSYSWATNGGNIVDGANTLMAEIDQPGTYTLTILNDDNSCESTQEVLVAQDVTIPEADAGEDFILSCFDDNFLDGTDSDQGFVYTYEWTTFDGDIVFGSNTLRPNIETGGTYLLTVINNENGCENTDEVLITSTIPEAIVNITPPLCFGDPATISVDSVEQGVSPYVYSIDGGDSFFGQGFFNNLEPGAYEVVVQDVNGCEYDESIVIEPKEEVVVSVSSATDNIRLGDELAIFGQTNIPDSSLAVINWLRDTSTLSCSDCLDPIARPFETTEYVLLVQDENGCLATTSLRIFVDRSADVFIPNAFSPDNSGSNDRFTVFARAESVVEVKSLRVFSRWGEIVFENKNFQPNDLSVGWDGTHRGRELNEAVFAYFAEVEMIDGRIEVFKGDVTLLY